MKQFLVFISSALLILSTGCGAQNSTTGALAGSNLPSSGVDAAIASAGVESMPAAGTASSQSGLVDMLVSQLGVSPAQATGGAGAIFSTAQQNMSGSDFAQVSNAVPGMDQMLSAAPSVSSPVSGATSLMGPAGGALGSAGGSVSNMAGLASSFQSLGLDSGMVNQFVPIVLDYVQSQGGSGTMGLLQSALGF